MQPACALQRPERNSLHSIGDRTLFIARHSLTLLHFTDFVKFEEVLRDSKVTAKSDLRQLKCLS
jgi:hypothetical protein